MLKKRVISINIPNIVFFEDSVTDKIGVLGLAQYLILTRQKARIPLGPGQCIGIF